MDLDAARAFLADHHRAVLTTVRTDGRPQLSPVLCGLDADGAVLVSSRQTAQKTANLRRRPQVSLCILSDDFFGEWVQIDGSVEIVGLPDAMEELVELYRTIAGEHPDWAGFRAAMAQERRVVLRITVERAGPGRAG